MGPLGRRGPIQCCILPGRFHYEVVRVERRKGDGETTKPTPDISHGDLGARFSVSDFGPFAGRRHGSGSLRGLREVARKEGMHVHLIRRSGVHKGIVEGERIAMCPGTEELFLRHGGLATLASEFGGERHAGGGL